MRGHLEQLDRAFGDVGVPSDAARLLGTVRIHSNVRRYRVALEVARAVLLDLFPESVPGASLFDLDDDHLERIFEAFVRNFAKRHLRKEWESIGRAGFQWSLDPESVLGRIETDVTLRRPGRSLVVEVKCYRKVIGSSRWGAPRVESKHLHQIHSYLRRERDLQGPEPLIEGVLLYAQPSGERIDIREILRPTPTSPQFPLRILTMDLDQDWEGIRTFLIELLHSGAS